MVNKYVYTVHTTNAYIILYLLAINWTHFLMIQYTFTTQIFQFWIKCLMQDKFESEALQQM